MTPMDINKTFAGCHLSRVQRQSSICCNHPPDVDDEDTNTNVSKGSRKVSLVTHVLARIRFAKSCTMVTRSSCSIDGAAENATKCKAT